jgi:TPP-dependent pyruvate/acetoin dehydrogenase alpha subunit
LSRENDRAGRADPEIDQLKRALIETKETYNRELEEAKEMYNRELKEAKEMYNRESGANLESTFKLIFNTFT